MLQFCIFLLRSSVNGRKYTLIALCLLNCVSKTLQFPGLSESTKPRSDEKGYFDLNLLDSLQSCGIHSPDADRVNDFRARQPFLAGIFLRTSSKDDFKFLTSAAIIGPNTVVTVFGGSYGSTLRKYARTSFRLPKPENLLVYAGLIYANISTADVHTQKREVSWIFPHVDRLTTNQEFYLVTIHMKESLNLTTPYIRALCLPYPELFLLEDINIRLLGGFSLPTSKHPLSKSSSTFIQELPLEICNKVFRFYYKTNMSENMECARQREDLCLSYGTGYGINTNGVFYLGGMLVLQPNKRKNICGTSEDAASTIFFFQNFKTSDIFKWMFITLICGKRHLPCPISGECIPLERVCNGIVDCGDGSKADEDPVYCAATSYCDKRTSFSCHLHGPCISKEAVCDNTVDCPGGNDEDSGLCGKFLSSNMTWKQSFGSFYSQSPDTGHTKDGASDPSSPASLVTCPSLQYGLGVETNCLVNNTRVSCDNSRQGTKLVAKCSKFYIPKFRANSLEVTCGADGNWQPTKSFACEADCGKPDGDSQEYLARGKKVEKKNSFPWFAAIYLWNVTAKRHNFICGASLIEPSVIVTAAHCLRTPDSELNLTDYKVVLGSKNRLDYDSDENSVSAQIEQVMIPKTFDSLTLFQSDLALVKLKFSMKFTEYIQPICYLVRKSRDDLVPGILGKVMGFGKDEYDKLQTDLHVANFPIISHEKCGEDGYEYNPSRAFCAGYGNGTGVCSGDSGSGFVVLDDNYYVAPRFVLKGVVSKGKTKRNGSCSFDTSSIFTRLDAYNDWIYDILELIDT